MRLAADTLHIPPVKRFDLTGREQPVATPTESHVEEPVRLVCPQCELVYRLKKFTPGRTYTCKSCGLPLQMAATPGDTEETGGRAAARKDMQTGRNGVAAGQAPESDLARLPKLIEQLTQHLDTIKGLEDAAQEDSPAARLLDIAGRLEGNLHDITLDLNRKFMELDDKVSTLLGPSLRESTSSLDHKIEVLDAKVTGTLEENLHQFTGNLGEKLEAFTGSLEERLGTLDEKVAAVSDTVAGVSEKVAGVSERVAGVSENVAAVSEKADAPSEALAALREEMRAIQQMFVERLEELRASQKTEFNALLAPMREEAANNTTVEVDIDELADRLVAGVRGHGSFYEPEAGTVVDAMARLADELVKEQNANTARLDKLAEEIQKAASGINKLDEWRGELPERVADEIGATVEARVVGPISGALARQAPSILSELQDSKLVDIVSRSVREAQRPLLREILSGGRSGVPAWLFASVLLPLLLILGYLFLPGEAGLGTAGVVNAEVADSLARIETMGVPLTPEAELQLSRSIAKTVSELQEYTLGQVKNIAALEETVRNLRSRIEERDKMLAEYATTLEKQTRRLQAYEMRLIQLGVSPNAVAGQQP